MNADDSGQKILITPTHRGFTFNDLRAKNATDEDDFEAAHNRLAHSDPEDDADGLRE